MMLLIERGRYDTHSDIVNPYDVFLQSMLIFIVFRFFLSLNSSKSKTLIQTCFQMYPTNNATLQSLGLN